MTIPLFYVSGSRREIGRALGELARPVLAEYWAKSPTWRALQPWRGRAHVAALAQCARDVLPAVWAELEGLAEGLGQPFDDVFLWHCRGDLLSTTDDGCTTVAVWAADGTPWIGHNEDGDPWLRGRCHMVDVTPDDAPGFLAFCYPGSLPGHAFGLNRCGLVQTINNLRVRALSVGVPRMLLARAVLDGASLGEALALLQHTPRAGAFHHTLGAADDPRLFSVEATPAVVSVAEIGSRYGHANHAIHPMTRGLQQQVTASSRARQARLDQLLADWKPGETGRSGCLSVLGDTAGELPILRTASDDPDDENTLATVLFEIRGGSASPYLFPRTVIG